MIHLWSVLCQKSIIDSDTNVLSLIGIMEKLIINLPKKESMKFKDTKKFLLVPANFELISYFVDIDFKKEKNIVLKVEIFTQDRKKIGEAERTLKIPTDSKKLRSRIRFDRLPINKSSEYTFVIKKKEKEKYRTLSNIPVSIELNEVD